VLKRDGRYESKEGDAILGKISFRKLEGF